MNTASSRPAWAAEQVQGESRKFIESLSQGKRLGYNSGAENCLASTRPWVQSPCSNIKMYIKQNSGNDGKRKPWSCTDGSVDYQHLFLQRT